MHFEAMELVDALAHQLNLDPVKAQALAGGVLGVVQRALGDQAGANAAAQFEAAIPELPGWKQAAEHQMGADAPSATESGLGGLLGSALGALGGGVGGAAGAAALLVPLLGKLGIEEHHVQLVVPLIRQFLGQRLDGGLLEQVKGILPFLADSDAEGGGAIGILGGLLG